MAVGGRKVVCVDLGHPTTTFELEKGEPEKGTAVMVVDAQDAVWVAYSNGEVFRIQEGKARLFTAEDGLSEGRECRLALDVSGRLWFLRGDWVGVFREGKFHALEPLGAQRFAAARSGGIWGWEGGRGEIFGSTPRVARVHWSGKRRPSWPRRAPRRCMKIATGSY